MVAPRNLFKSNIVYLHLLIVITAVFIVDANCLSNDFVYDDKIQVIENNFITDFKYIPDLFSHNVALSNKGELNYYRPIMNIVYMINYHVFGGLKAWGFHFVNVLFHVGVTILVYLITTNFLRDDKSKPSGSLISVPLVASLIFAVHPINSEAIAWIACIPELTFTLFSLLSLNFHIKSCQNFDKSHLFSVAFFLIAIFCKETAVTLLPLLILYDYVFRSVELNIRRIFLRYLPFAVIVGLYLILRINALGGMAPVNRHPELNTFEVIINIIPLFCQYLEKLLLPINLNAYYVLHPVHSIIEFRFLFSLTMIGVFIVLAYLLFKKNKTAFLGLMIITIPLLPVLYIRGLGENTFADRYLYLPSIGFGIIFGQLFSIERLNRINLKRPLTIIFVSILTVYSIGTIRRNKVWHDELSLWGDTKQKSPDGSTALDNYGVALTEKGDLDAAIQTLKEAIRLAPNSSSPHDNLGIALGEKGDLEAAISEHSVAIHLSSKRELRPHMNLASALAKKRDFDGAIREYLAALQISPNDNISHYNLGRAYVNKGDLDAAIQEFQIALRIKPIDIQVHNNLGLVHAEKGNLAAAIQEYEVALRISPNDAMTHNNLGVALIRKGDLNTAITEFQNVIRVKPNDINAHCNLGVVHAKKGDFDAAIREFQNALRINPNDTFANNNLNLSLSQKQR